MPTASSGYIDFGGAIRSEERRVRRESRRADINQILQGVLGLAGGIAQNRQQRHDASTIQSILESNSPRTGDESDFFADPPGTVPDLSGMSPQGRQQAMAMLQQIQSQQRADSQRAEDMNYRRSRDATSDQRWQAGHDLDRERIDTQNRTNAADRNLSLFRLTGMLPGGGGGGGEPEGPQPMLPPDAAEASPAALRDYADDEYRMRHNLYQQQEEARMRGERSAAYEQNLMPMLSDPSDIAHFRVALDDYRSGAIDANSFARRFSDIQKEQQERTTGAAEREFLLGQPEMQDQNVPAGVPTATIGRVYGQRAIEGRENLRGERREPNFRTSKEWEKATRDVESAQKAVDRAQRAFDAVADDPKATGHQSMKQRLRMAEARLQTAEKAVDTILDGDQQSDDQPAGGQPAPSQPSQGGGTVNIRLGDGSTVTVDRAWAEQIRAEEAAKGGGAADIADRVQRRLKNGG